jgi:hypothetical protein
MVGIKLLWWWCWARVIKGWGFVCTTHLGVGIPLGEELEDGINLLINFLLCFTKKFFLTLSACTVSSFFFRLVFSFGVEFCNPLFVQYSFFLLYPINKIPQQEFSLLYHFQKKSLSASSTCFNRVSVCWNP